MPSKYPQILSTSHHRHCPQPEPSHHISPQLLQKSLIISGLFYFQCNQQPEWFCGNMSQISWCFCSKLSLVSQNLQSAPWSSSQLLPFHLLTFCYHPQPCSLCTGHSGLLPPLEHATINLISKLVDRLFLLLESSSPRYLHGSSLKSHFAEGPSLATLSKIFVLLYQFLSPFYVFFPCILISKFYIFYFSTFKNYLSAPTRM